jgi:hypothetical protein
MKSIIFLIAAVLIVKGSHQELKSWLEKTLPYRKNKINKISSILKVGSASNNKYCKPTDTTAKIMQKQSH